MFAEPDCCIAGAYAPIGRGGCGGVAAPSENGREGEGSSALELDPDAPLETDEPDPLAEEFAAIDAVLARSTKVLEGGVMPAAGKPASVTGRQPQNGLVYDLDWDEDARLAEWQDVLADTRELPAVLRAAILLEAWSDIEVLQHAAWLGPLLVAALLRQEGLAAGHLACLHLGAKNIPRERRRARSRKRPIVGVCRRHPGSSAGRPEGARSAGAGEKPDGAAAA